MMPDRDETIPDPNALAACPQCNGTKSFEGEECALCLGYGTVAASLRALVLDLPKRLERELDEAQAEVARLRAERDAIERWAIRHAGYIGTFDLEVFPPITMWWAMGDNGRVEGRTASEVVRRAAGLEVDG